VRDCSHLSIRDVPNVNGSDSPLRPGFECKGLLSAVGPRGSLTYGNSRNNVLAGAGERCAIAGLRKQEGMFFPAYDENGPQISPVGHSILLEKTFSVLGAGQAQFPPCRRKCSYEGMTNQSTRPLSPDFLTARQS
jgi:hypothetical protein